MVTRRSHSGRISFKRLLAIWKLYPLTVSCQGSNGKPEVTWDGAQSSPSFIGGLPRKAIRFAPEGVTKPECQLHVKPQQTAVNTVGYGLAPSKLGACGGVLGALPAVGPLPRAPCP